MKYIALNGFRHSLRRYFNDNVECVERFNWTHRNAVEYAKTITEPTCLIGFSDGATAALAMANESDMVKRVYAHSPQFRAYIVESKADVFFYATHGDRTGTFMDTHDAHRLWQTNKRYYAGYVTSLKVLEPLPHVPIRDLATFIMRIKTHQFHNCLTHLPSQIIHPDFS
jgi:hypothetical protein